MGVNLSCQFKAQSVQDGQSQFVSIFNKKENNVDKRQLVTIDTIPTKESIANLNIKSDKRRL